MTISTCVSLIVLIRSICPHWCVTCATYSGYRQFCGAQRQTGRKSTIMRRFYADWNHPDKYHEYELCLKHWLFQKNILFLTHFSSHLRWIFFSNFTNNVSLTGNSLSTCIQTFMRSIIYTLFTWSYYHNWKWHAWLLKIRHDLTVFNNVLTLLNVSFKKYKWLIT